MVSFDIVSLFTKVPVEHSLSLLGHHFTDDILALFKLVLTHTDFCVNGQYYEQTDHVGMGSPLSPVMANFFMEEFEKKGFNQATVKPTCWYRFVDDTFVIWPHGKTSITDFLEHLHKLHKNIVHHGNRRKSPPTIPGYRHLQERRRLTGAQSIPETYSHQSIPTSTLMPLRSQQSLCSLLPSPQSPRHV
jgi:hypothetical protein